MQNVHLLFCIFLCIRNLNIFLYINTSKNVLFPSLDFGLAVHSLVHLTNKMPSTDFIHKCTWSKLNTSPNCHLLSDAFHYSSEIYVFTLWCSLKSGYILMTRQIVILRCCWNVACLTALKKLPLNCDPHAFTFSDVLGKFSAWAMYTLQQ